MTGLAGMIVLHTALSPIAEAGNWRRIGPGVMIPDGREGLVPLPRRFGN